MPTKKKTQGELSLPDPIEAETEAIEKGKQDLLAAEVGRVESVRSQIETDPNIAQSQGSPLAGHPAVGARFSRVMADLEKILATGQHDHFGFRYPTEFDLTEAIRPLLGRHQIGIASEISEVERFERIRLDPSTGQEFKSDWSRVWLRIHAAVDEPPYPCATFEAVGEGEGDKGIYKAQTGALNYWLRKTFLAGATAAEDPEQSSPAPRASHSTETSANVSNGISDGQRRRLYGVGKNLTKVRIHEIIEQHTGNKSATSISRGAQYDGIIAQIEEENESQSTRPTATNSPPRHEPVIITDDDIPF